MTSFDLELVVIETDAELVEDPDRAPPESESSSEFERFAVNRGQFVTLSTPSTNHERYEKLAGFGPLCIDIYRQSDPIYIGKNHGV